MTHAIVTAFVIVLVVGAVVQKGDSYIRAGREMAYENQAKPVQFAENYYDRAEVRRASRPFKKGKKRYRVAQGCSITNCTSPILLGGLAGFRLIKEESKQARKEGGRESGRNGGKEEGEKKGGREIRRKGGKEGGGKEGKEGG